MCGYSVAPNTTATPPPSHLPPYHDPASLQTITCCHVNDGTWQRGLDQSMIALNLSRVLCLFAFLAFYL